MKLKFKNQDFQIDAVNAVCDLFTGQERIRSTFAIQGDNQLHLFGNEYGIGNRLIVGDDVLLSNMNAVQKRYSLPQTTLEERNAKNGTSRSFCVEMETGTGKTYVYTKTIFELNKKYGFTKFIIVVPSVAIREGVYKSFQITHDHFANQYDNVPCRYFIYNSAKLSDVRQFATSANIEIMIINIDAFKKAENIINQVQDKLNGETAMRYIQDTNPFVIIDEPQSVDNTPKAKEAIASLSPLCVFRYSATHREKINLLYRLTPVDAYQMGLVKQICVSSNQTTNNFNKPYVRLIAVSNDNGFRAKLELDVQDSVGKVRRKEITVKPDADLYQLSGERELYEGYTVNGIDCTPGFECVEFTNTEVVGLGKAIGTVDENIIKRAQIRRTIEAHFIKEMMYLDKGIKVLSLFFIDEVGKYRAADGGKGVYALMFEECYNELINLSKYAVLREKFRKDVSAVHDGYFSQDKMGNYKNTRGDTIADFDTYNTIMKDKEWLLSFDCPLRFIFSHSALKEGWDNPNVFQVCTLIDQKSTFTCRQKIGRGLRLCVNQDGDRIEDKDINVLHVMANESFAEFADTLQKEIEQETGVKFGYIDISLFSGMMYTEEIVQEKNVDEADAQALISFMKNHGYIEDDGRPTELAKAAIVDRTAELPPQMVEIKERVAQVIKEDTAVTPEALIGAPYFEKITVENTVSYEEAKDLIAHFEEKGYVTKNGRIKDTMKSDLLSGKLDLPIKYEAARDKFEAVISKADQKPPIRDASRDVTVRIKKQAVLSPEFLELWNRIKQKTSYRVEVDTDELIRGCVKDIAGMEPIPKARIISQTADIHIEQAGVSHFERDYRTSELKDSYSVLPNIIGVLSEQCLITRRTANAILQESGRLKDFINNPQLFIERVTEIINNHRYQLAIDGIRYIKLDGKEYSVMEIFDSTELIANLDKNAVAVQRSVYDYVIYDSETIEKPFALALDNDPYVKMFFKIPTRFKIETPIGTYNPDWSVYFEKDGIQKLYFVLETKGRTNLFELSTPEQLKIHCGRRHFEALDTDIEYHVTTNWNKYKLGI